uniref:Bardet-Biedl syndrome 10 n=1 Tax=Myripristis murdjan TaxID=586833 RepID=A0A667YVF4_9TELE
MSHVERPHLKHVLHTVSVLEAVVLRSFGPDGGQVLFTRDTGQVMLSRSGTRILTALRLEHPLARMVVECVWKHTAVTGDGSKNFILLLASLLRVIHTAACKRCNVSHTYSSREAMENATARHLADTLLAFGLEELGDVISTGVVPYGGVLSWEDPSAHAVPAHTNKDMHTLQKLLTAFFHTRLGHTYCDFFSRLTCEFLSCWKCEDKAPSYLLHLIDDNFSVLHTPVSGFPVSCSRVIEGQVIHRDFSTPFSWTNNQPVKAVVFSGHLHPDAHKAGAVLELRGGERGVLRYTSCTERSLECVITTLQSLGVSLLLCAVKQSEAVLALAGLSGMCVVDFLFHRYIHMSFHDSEIKPHSLVICGAGEGQTDQCACAFQDALRMLHTTWEPMHTTATTAAKSILHSGKSRSPSSKPPLQKNVLNPGCVVPVGGTFEFLLHHALLQHDTGIPALSRLLADALLCVPQQIYSHSPRRYLQTQTLVTNYIELRVGHCRKVDFKSDVFTLDSGVESVSCKYKLILAVLQCLSSLLRLDAVLHTHTPLHKQACRHSSSSLEDTEEGDED